MTKLLFVMACDAMLSYHTCSLIFKTSHMILNCILLIVCVSIEEVFGFSSVGPIFLPEVKETSPHLQGMLSCQSKRPTTYKDTYAYALFL